MSRATNPALAAKLEAERRLKEGISGHRTGLPKKLLDLFAPLEQPAQLTTLKKPKLKLPYTGVAQYINDFAEPGDPEYEPSRPEGGQASPRLHANPELKAQVRLDTETRYEKRLRKTAEQQEKAKQQIEEGLKTWEPSKDPTATGDPFKTLFVARVSYEATEKKLKRDFEEYGPVKSIRLVHNRNNGKSRGYAFIEFEHKNDMKLAYKMADGKKIEGKRVVVDVERGRAVPNWRPRRFGGGKGGESRAAKVSKKKSKIPASALPPAAAPAPAATDRPAEHADRPPPSAAKEREREPAAPRERERDRGEKEWARERDRPRGGDMSRVPPPGHSSPRREAPRDRDMNGGMGSTRDADRRDRDRDRARDRDRDRDRDRKRHEREPGERDYREDPHRSNKRYRDEGDRSRRRERDLV